MIVNKPYQVISLCVLINWLPIPSPLHHQGRHFSTPLSPHLSPSTTKKALPSYRPSCEIPTKGLTRPSRRASFLLLSPIPLPIPPVFTWIFAFLCIWLVVSLVIFRSFGWLMMFVSAVQFSRKVFLFLISWTLETFFSLANKKFKWGIPTIIWIDHNKINVTNICINWGCKIWICLLLPSWDEVGMIIIVTVSYHCLNVSQWSVYWPKKMMNSINLLSGFW